MIVEFIGASGAGKTTAARRLSSESGDRYMMQSDLITDVIGLRWATNPHLVNVVADVRALRPFRLALGTHREFVDYAFDRLRRHAPTKFARYNYMRNIIRKLGVYQLSQEREELTILADEGTLLSAYQLFVYSLADFDSSDIAEFASMVPLPQQVVYVRTPLDVLVERARGRPDRRRELSGAGDEEIERALTKAVTLFDTLVAAPPVKDRALVVESAELDEEGLALIKGDPTPRIRDTYGGSSSSDHGRREDAR